MRIRVIGPIAVLFLFLIGWEGVVRLWEIPEYLVAPPSAIFRYSVDNLGDLSGHFLITMTEAAAGFLLGSSVGFLLAVGFSHSRTLEYSLYPYMIALKAVPIVALAPLLVLWFGNGIPGKVVMAALICFFPVIVNVAIGLRAVDPGLHELFRSLAASRSQIFFKLRLPSSLPYLFASFRIGSTLSVVGAIVGEFSGARSGLGYLMVVSVYQLETPALFAGIVAASLGGIAFFYLIVWLESLFVHWEPRDTKV